MVCFASFIRYSISFDIFQSEYLIYFIGYYLSYFNFDNDKKYENYQILLSFLVIVAFIVIKLQEEEQRRINIFLESLRGLTVNMSPLHNLSLFIHNLNATISCRFYYITNIVVIISFTFFVYYSLLYNNPQEKILVYFYYLIIGMNLLQVVIKVVGNFKKVTLKDGNFEVPGRIYYFINKHLYIYASYAHDYKRISEQLEKDGLLKKPKDYDDKKYFEIKKTI